jgi:hypothetical protein
VLFCLTAQYLFGVLLFKVVPCRGPGDHDHECGCATRFHLSEFAMHFACVAIMHAVEQHYQSLDQDGGNEVQLPQQLEQQQATLQQVFGIASTSTQRDPAARVRVVALQLIQALRLDLSLTVPVIALKCVDKGVSGESCTASNAILSACN